jgi:hypothetical protein
MKLPLLLLLLPLSAISSPINHVFMILLENKDYQTAFTPNSYLTTLSHQGALLPNSYGIGHNSLTNYIALISGQSPNQETQEDCKTYSDFKSTTFLPYNQLQGKGCVYPSTIPTLPLQLTNHNLTWKGYMEDMGKDPKRESPICGHPTLNKKDHTQKASQSDYYVTKHNPFVYFHSIIDTDQCNNDVNLQQLPIDLKSIKTTPNFSFISPNICNDSHDPTGKNNETCGLQASYSFLQHYVPLILNSPAYKQDGLLIITFDESTTPESDSSSCCGEIGNENARYPGIKGLGGGRIGTIVLSPFIKPNTISYKEYNHYSILKTIEDIFNLPYLGYANLPGVHSYGKDVCSKLDKSC